METKKPRVERSNCSVLPLVLKGKWFNMIASGEKREEYRTSENVCRQIERWVGHSMIMDKYMIVEFFLGYQRDRPKMAFLACMPEFRDGAEHPDWGEPDFHHYVIKLVERVEIVE